MEARETELYCFPFKSLVTAGAFVECQPEVFCQQSLLEQYCATHSGFCLSWCNCFWGKAVSQIGNKFVLKIIVYHCLLKTNSQKRFLLILQLC